MNEAKRKMWQEIMEEKSALTMYRTQKTKKDIRKEQAVVYSLGHSLLFEARTGVLKTKIYRDKFRQIYTYVPCTCATI